MKREEVLLGPLSRLDALLLAFFAEDSEAVHREDGYYVTLRGKPEPGLLATALVLGAKLRGAEENIPREFNGITRCPNPTCISNQPREKASRRFRLLKGSRGPVLQCVYCGTLIDAATLRAMLAEEACRLVLGEHC